jgi:hypothetical protein
VGLRGRLSASRGVAAAALVAALALVACKKPAPETKDAGAPVDHLAPGDSVEGKDKAFALTLPRAATVAARFPESVRVKSTLLPEQLVKFVETRVSGGRVDKTPAKTTFEDVVVPSEPTRHLTIEITPGSGYDAPKSEMLVKDVTPAPPADPNTTDRERWKKAGLDESGRPLDPKRLQ